MKCVATLLFAANKSLVSIKISPKKYLEVKTFATGTALTDNIIRDTQHNFSDYLCQ